MSYYSILKVHPHASPYQIKKSYRKLVFAHHPDRNPDDASSEKTFRRIQQAFETLSDPQQRRKYDLRHLRKTRPKETKSTWQIKNNAVFHSQGKLVLNSFELRDGILSALLGTVATLFVTTTLLMQDQADWSFLIGVLGLLFLVYFVHQALLGIAFKISRNQLNPLLDDLFEMASALVSIYISFQVFRLGTWIFSLPSTSDGLALSAIASFMGGIVGAAFGRAFHSEFGYKGAVLVATALALVVSASSAAILSFFRSFSKIASQGLSEVPMDNLIVQGFIWGALFGSILGGAIGANRN